MAQNYLVKIIPPRGYRVHRIEFTRTHLFVGIAACAVLLVSLGVYCFGSVNSAQSRVRELRTVDDTQQQALTHMNMQAEAIGREIRRLQEQNQQIRRLMGADPQAQRASAKAPPASQQQQPIQQQSARAQAFGTVADRLGRLDADARVAGADGDRLRALAMRVLNVRRIADLARARVLAEIPSINPAPGSGIASSFGWRILPWPSYHQGVDLDANYGDAVVAAAAGTVAFVGWDGGYGLKVDIDHHNGYHTWYAHLSRADVQQGQYVRKAEEIAKVGATGDATGPHLHYQMLLGGHVIDPTPYLTGVPDRVLASLK